MKKFIIGCLMVGAISSYSRPASADQVPNPSGKWTVVTKSADNTVFQIDNNIYRQGQVAGFWIQSHESNGRRAANYIGTNCSNRAYQSFAGYNLNSVGNVVGKSYARSQIDFAQNGSVIAILIDAACGNSRNAQADVTKAQLEALTRNSQTSAEIINRAMESAANMFR